MADGLCGPSNALKNFQKHVSNDRTSQQDRLISRQSPLQGFKSIPGPSSAYLESDLEAFQNAPSLPDLAFAPYPASQNTHSLHQPQLDSWASDFKKLNFSEDINQQYELTMDPSQRHLDGSDWHQDFKRRNITDDSAMPLPMNNRMQMNSGMGIMADPYIGVAGGMLNQDYLQPKQQKPSEDTLDQEAFSRAFDLVAGLERESTQEIVQESRGPDQHNLTSNPNTDRTSSLRDDIHLTQAPIGADTIKCESSTGDGDPEMLSLTASKLLNNVDGEKDIKFHNSRFLELMRRFRDREATIQGDQVVGNVLDT